MKMVEGLLVKIKRALDVKCSVKYTTPHENTRIRRVELQMRWAKRDNMGVEALEASGFGRW